MGHYSIDRAAMAALPDHPEIDIAVARVSGEIYRDSQALVPQPGQADDPYATGRLKASGFVDRNGGSDYRVGYDTPYASFVEFGTSEMDAEPYLTPAALRYRGKR